METMEVMKQEELHNINGGMPAALEVTFAIIGAYGVLREMVKEAGKQAAYRDLGM